MISTIKRNLKNIRGYSSKDKIIVFEVDDWGAVTIPDSKTFHELSALKILDENDRFNRFDYVASATDLSLLFQVLSSHKDELGSPAVFTAFSVMANPDFNKLIDTGQYHYEKIDTTLNRLLNKNPLEIWQQGIDSGVFHPEFHGREHVNPFMMMNAYEKDLRFRTMCEKQSLGVLKKNLLSIPDYLKAFNFQDRIELKEQEKFISDGIAIFREIIGYKPQHFTSPGLIHHPDIEEKLFSEGIKFIDVAKRRLIPEGVKQFSKELNWTGKKNRYNQIYITRNMRFEPSINQDFDWVNHCLKEIEISFRWKKPAIISSHRVNFVSGREEKNRDLGLKKLDQLLHTILKKWPEIRFLNSVELGLKIKNG